MAFLTDDDYAALVDEDDLAALTDSTNTTVRSNAEAAAQEEAASYLRGRYDIATAYQASGATRNRQLVQAVTDIALWNLVPRVALRNISEIRELRYKASLTWLKLVATGMSNPDLPSYPPDTTQPQAHRLFRYGSDRARVQSF